MTTIPHHRAHVRRKNSTVSRRSVTTIPVVVTATGSYRQVTRFLQHMRALVSVRGGAVRATGRLLTMQSVELVESATRKFPFLDATITLNGWHQVVMNTEGQSKAMRNVAFLD